MNDRAVIGSLRGKVCNERINVAHHSPADVPVSPPNIVVDRFLAKPHGLYIDGRWQAAASSETFDVVNPATGEVIAQAARGDAADIDAAVRGPAQL